jgi:predicted ATPase/DNA-binding SARP family transcriptional activator/Tfp pilus assembly protein PilF
MDGDARTFQAESPARGGSDRCRLRLVGLPILSLGAVEHPLAPERRHQMLSYLACRGGWVARGEIAELFWEAHAADLARRNLRRLLHDIRRMGWVAGIESEGDCLRWRVPSDLADFAAARARGDWDASVRLGAGTLLAGIEKGATNAYYAWLRNERQAHLTRWRECVARRDAALQDDAPGRIELARFALAHDPCNEAAARSLVDALRACGRDGEAEQSYRTFAERMQEELGVEPVVRAADACVRSGPQAPVPSVDPEGGLIGRKLEQSRLAQILRRRECRRATILGPGGVGKSSLAMTARSLLRADFPDGVRWVGLRDLTSPTQIPSRIAEACGFKGALSKYPLASLGARIGRQHILLVLDNCEHLPQIGAIGDALLAACPNLKLLHASRARIGGEGEWLLPLTGLAVPDADERDLDILRTFDSVRLFEARAREVDPAFDARRSVDAIAELVRMVEGLPLAIQMAAACSRLLPLPEIVRDLSRLLDLPDPSAGGPGTPASAERSLRASFEQSWRLLAESEQATLARLSVFTGSFSLVAAQAVAGAELAAIAALADKSLVSPCGDGRFSLHPLIREFARAHLPGEPRVRGLHAEHFARVLIARGDPATAASVPWSLEDVSHCLEAWRWATTTNDVALLLRMARPLVRLFNQYLRWQEGIDTIEATLASLASRGACAERLRAELGYGLALCRFYHGEMASAEVAARLSLRRCHGLRIRDQLPAGNLYLIGASFAWRGERVRARRFYQQSLAVAVARRESESIAKALYGLAIVEQADGNWARARDLHGQCVARCEEMSAHHQWLALALNNMGICFLAEGSPQEALACFDQGIRVCTEHEVYGRRSFLLANRALALIMVGDLGQARTCVERAQREAHEWNICTARAESHLAGAALAMSRGELALARHELREALRHSRKTQSPVRQLSVIRQWGQWLVASGELERGAIVLDYVRIHDMSLRRDKDIARSELEALTRAGSGPGAVRRRARFLSHDSLQSEIMGIDEAFPGGNPGERRRPSPAYRPIAAPTLG